MLLVADSELRNYADQWAVDNRRDPRASPELIAPGA